MITIAIGHSRRGDNGARSVGGAFEWSWNRLVGLETVEILTATGIPAVLVDDYPTSSYTAAMSWLSRLLQRNRSKACIELHFNASADPQSHGYEYLHWPASSRGATLADSLASAHSRHFPDFRARHLDGTLPRSAGNGSVFLKKTPCAAVIAEPFFGSNPAEWAAYSAAPALLARSYADGIAAWLQRS